MSPAGYAIDTSFAKTSIVSSWMYGAMSATHETSARPSVMISASMRPGRSPCGLRRRTSESSPIMSAG